MGGGGGGGRGGSGTPFNLVGRSPTFRLNALDYACRLNVLCVLNHVGIMYSGENLVRRVGGYLGRMALAVRRVGPQ